MNTKFVTCLFLMLCIMGGVGLADAVYVENFSFEEPGGGKVSGWDEEDGASFVDSGDPAEVPGWNSDGAANDSGVETDWNPTDGLYTAYLMGDDPSVWNLTEHIIAAGEAFVLTFDAQETWLGLDLQADLFYDDNGTRVQVATDTFAVDPGMVEYTLSFESDNLPESVGHRIGIEFKNLTAGGTWLGIDNVRLESELKYTSLVYPPNGGMYIPLDAVLKWTLKEGFNCDVYFGTQGDPNVTLNEKVIENELVTEYDPFGPGPEGNLDFDTTYYWRVDAVEPNEGGIGLITYPGATWRFTTIPEEVTIITQPQNQTVPIMGTVVFTVEALSPYPITYKWYKVGQEQDTLSDMDTFSRDNVQVGDEGYYCCELKNDVSTVITEPARLITERLVGWWKLDGDLKDSVGEVVEGAPAHDGEMLDSDPNWVIGGGVGGSDAIEFFGDGRVVVIADSNEYYNFYPRGQTVSAWVKTTTVDWMGIMGKHNELLWRGWAVDIKGDSDEFTFVIRNIHGDLYGSNDLSSINDNEYHLVTSVIDPNYYDRTCVSKLYVDGVLRATSGRYEMAAVLADSMTPMPLVIGAEGDDGRASIVAVIDEVKVYSYALDAIDIALLYTDFKEGENVCINQDDAWRYYDVVGEKGEPSWCKVDIEDIAEFVNIWMECALVPKCLQ
ncbi:MAG: immunoglobulin domain-containing protein [Planctomycetota bacterium]|nr:MAG: immunoglobulin domain-containing protein [Planctomycetota bacterium]